MKNQTTVTVVYADQEDDSFPPIPALAFQAWLAAKLQTIPHTDQPTATIRFSSGYDDEAPVTINFEYTRLETDEEEFERERAYQRRRAEAHKRNQERELKEYNRLKAKYGDRHGGI